MKRLVVLVAGWFCVTPFLASAQSLQPGATMSTTSTPRLEIGVNTSYASLLNEDAKTIGMRFGHRYRDWLVSEWNIENTENRLEPDSQLLIADVRLQTPISLVGKRPFVTAGIAGAKGLSFRWSPMVGAGAQVELPNGIAAARVEFQYLTRAREEYHDDDRVRLIVGVSIGLP